MYIERIIDLDHDSVNQETYLEVKALLDEQGPKAAIDFLKQWHYPGEHETADEPGAGTADDVDEDSDGYILTYNSGLDYIALEYREQEDN